MSTSILNALTKKSANLSYAPLISFVLKRFLYILLLILKSLEIILIWNCNNFTRRWQQKPARRISSVVRNNYKCYCQDRTNIHIDFGFEDLACLATLESFDTKKQSVDDNIHIYKEREGEREVCVRACVRAWVEKRKTKERYMLDD